MLEYFDSRFLPRVQGSQTRCAQVAAHSLGIPLEMVTVRPASSDVCANASPTGGTVSSHVAMRLVKQAAEKILKRLNPLKEGVSETADSCKYRILK